MMRILFVLILSLISFNASSQLDSLVIYERGELIEFDPDTIYALSYSRMKLQELPGELASFKNLVYLDLSKNKISSLGEDFTHLTSLSVINLEKNKIAIFPVQFCRMSQIKKLIINRNEIESLPECIENMKALEYLDLYDNPIRSLPASLEQMDSLKKIDLSGIRFSPSFQDSWNSRLPQVDLVFDAPCDCME